MYHIIFGNIATLAQQRQPSAQLPDRQNANHCMSIENSSYGRHLPNMWAGTLLARKWLHGV
jgi:hypothetical protein